MSNSQDKPGFLKYLLVFVVAALAGIALYLFIYAKRVRGEHGFITAVWAMFIAWFDVVLGAGTLFLVRKHFLLALVTSLALALALFMGIYIYVTVAI